MVPFRHQVIDQRLSFDVAPHRLGALRHAVLHGRPELWADDPDRPASLVWLREGDENGWEAFAEGLASPALEWLAARVCGRPIALLAPSSWETPIRQRGGRVDIGIARTWSAINPRISICPEVQTRRLTLADGPAFEAVAPSWALRSWDGFASMIHSGAAFGLPSGDTFAAIAWTYESDSDHDKVGVATIPQFRRLGLGKAVASAMIAHILRDRRKQPLWVTTPANVASMALARSLGFTRSMDEVLIRWSPAGFR